MLIYSDGKVSDVTILDISRSGFRIEVAESPRVGELVTLRVEHDHAFPAQMRWALGSQAGGIFLPAAGDPNVRTANG